MSCQWWHGVKVGKTRWNMISHSTSYDFYSSPRYTDTPATPLPILPICSNNFNLCHKILYNDVWLCLTSLTILCETNIAPENRPSQTEISSSNHWFSGAMLVSGRVIEMNKYCTWRILKNQQEHGNIMQCIYMIQVPGPPTPPAMVMVKAHQPPLLPWNGLGGGHPTFNQKQCNW